jgi:hypothetical protein
VTQTALLYVLFNILWACLHPQKISDNICIIYSICAVKFNYLFDLYWIIGRKSTTSLDSKVLLHKTVIKPIWTYGIELWGCASKSRIDIMQRSQSKILRMITNPPWYVSNQTIHVDLHVPFIKDVIQEKSKKHHYKLGHHSNAILQPLLAEHQRRRLKTFWPADQIDGWRGSLIGGDLIPIQEAQENGA